jgi:hypothetical protein
MRKIRRRRTRYLEIAPDLLVELSRPQLPEREERVRIRAAQLVYTVSS